MLKNIEREKKTKTFHHEYEKYGKTSGSIKNIPYDICGVCGEFMYQPLPTGLWLHTSAEPSNDYTDSKKHYPRPATTLELLLILNEDEESYVSSYGDFIQYGDTRVEKKNHCACMLHRKYWTNELGLDIDNTPYLNHHPKNIETYDDTDWSDYYGKPNFGAYYWRTQRTNFQLFADFIVDRNQKSLKENLPINGKCIVEFYQRKDIRNTFQINSFRKRKYDHDNVPQQGDEIKIGDTVYVVISVSGNKILEYDGYFKARLHIQPKSKAKKWLKHENETNMD